MAAVSNNVQVPLVVWNQLSSTINDLVDTLPSTINDNIRQSVTKLNQLFKQYDEKSGLLNLNITNNKGEDDMNNDNNGNLKTPNNIDSTLNEMKIEEFEQMMDNIEIDNKTNENSDDKTVTTRHTQTKVANETNTNTNSNATEWSKDDSSKKKKEIEIDFDKCFSVAFDAAIEAGRLIYDVSIDSETLLGVQNRSKTKLNHADIVTEIDKASEKLIMSKLHASFENNNDYFILSEESAKKEDIYKVDEISNNKLVWCIDPIDGTTNFFFGIPMTCISIGLRYKKESILGIVYNPIINELFFGIKGNGAYLLDTTKLGKFNIGGTLANGKKIIKNGFNQIIKNGAFSPKTENAKNGFKFNALTAYNLASIMKISERIQTSSMTFIPKIDENDTNSKNKIETNSNTMSIGLKKAMVLTYAGYGSDIASVDSLKRLKILLTNEKVRGLRMLGSCAIGMCYVACGRGHIYFEGKNRKYGIKPWDVVAAECIVKEAGGCVCLPDDIDSKKPYDCTTGKVLACNNVTAATVFEHLQLYPNENYDINDNNDNNDIDEAKDASK